MAPPIRVAASMAAMAMFLDFMEGYLVVFFLVYGFVVPATFDCYIAMRVPTIFYLIKLEC
ncbi:hypothetical protein KM92DES2_11339 [uncultured Desulfovibrio sp.]|uniref:Uncharacterized protein n=1 Tax=uncultured Desulfovibrio sp. TaxID=167968 RepID=A0A212JLI1_9BACT|nr:hypothetical protein KM92DES2_11339 [uncultured Desulfovibrio sp.]